MKLDGSRAIEMFNGVIGKFLLASIGVIVAALTVLFLVFDQPLSLLQQNAIITPIAFVAAAFANATAVGGGFLFVPLFIYGYGLAPIAALQLSLATQAFGMTSGAVGWSKSFIDRGALLVGGFSSLVGMWLGTVFWQIPAESIKPLFGWVSLFIFAAILIEVKLGKDNKNTSANFSFDGASLGYGVAALFGGCITAWTAIGVGEFVALYLMFVYRMRIQTAIGTGVAVLAIDSIAGFVFHSVQGGIRWDLLMFTVPGVVLGGFFGARAGRYVEQKFFNAQKLAVKSSGMSPLKWVFSLIVFVDGTSILIDSYIYR